jgi:hypothetical protein
LPASPVVTTTLNSLFQAPAPISPALPDFEHCSQIPRNVLADFAANVSGDPLERKPHRRLVDGVQHSGQQNYLQTLPLCPDQSSVRIHTFSSPVTSSNLSDNFSQTPLSVSPMSPMSPATPVMPATPKLRFYAPGNKDKAACYVASEQQKGKTKTDVG